MRIAQIAPLYESVPPHYYGGTERVVSYLTEELVRQGHEVTLFASADSVTRAKLQPLVPRALRLDESCIDPIAHHVHMVEKVAQMADEFDVLHFHIDYVHFPTVRMLKTAHISTLHGRLDIPDLTPLYSEFRDIPLVSISNDQRRPLRSNNWRATVYHGLPPQQYPFAPHAGEYLVFLGRMSPEKRVDRAIEIAKRTGRELYIAAKVAKVEENYFNTRVKPLLNHPLIHFLGEVSETEKHKLLCGALAMVFPIDWPEPFGLVMIESLACGTPVVAFRCGAVPEVIDDGETGFVVNSIEHAVAAVERVGALNRARCRAVFEARFSVERMTRDYLAVYRALTKRALRPMSVA